MLSPRLLEWNAFGASFSRSPLGTDFLVCEQDSQGLCSLTSFDPARIQFGSTTTFASSGCGDIDASASGWSCIESDENLAPIQLLRFDAQTRTSTRVTLAPVQPWDFLWVHRVVAADGSFLMVWRTAPHGSSTDSMFAQRFDRDGTALGARVSIAPDIDVHDDSLFELVATADGALATWSGAFNRPSGRFAVRLDRSGRPLQPAAAIDDSPERVAIGSEPSLAVAHGDALLLWIRDESDGPRDLMLDVVDVASGRIRGAPIDLGIATTGRHLAVVPEASGAVIYYDDYGTSTAVRSLSLVCGT